MDITKIPLQELLDDRAASLADIKVCELALLHNIKQYSGGSTQRRLNVNRGIVKMIDEELARQQSQNKRLNDTSEPENWAEAIIKQDVELLDDQKPCR